MTMKDSIDVNARAWRNAAATTFINVALFTKRTATYCLYLHESSLFFSAYEPPCSPL